MRIKIVQQGWIGYTGIFGGVKFTKGESDEISAVQARQVGNIMQVRNMKDDANPSSSQQAADSRTYVAAAEVNAERQVPEKPAVKTVYTREELETIASDKGIKGLREIANTIGVKGNSINVLIEALMNHYKGDATPESAPEAPEGEKEVSEQEDKPAEQENEPDDATGAGEGQE